MAYYEIPDNTKCLLHFEENLEDAVGLVTPTIPTGSVSYEKGKYKKGITFDGASCVGLPLTDDLKLGSNDFTIAFWFRLDSELADGNSFSLLSQKYRYSSSYADAGFKITRNNSAASSNAKKIIVGINYTYRYKITSLVSTSDIELETWYHLAITRSGSTFSLFINGVLEATSTSSSSVYCGGSNPWTIGCRIGDDSTVSYIRMVDGVYDEFIFINGTCLWTEDFEVPTMGFGQKIDPIFQSGIVGSTNIIEGITIPFGQVTPDNTKFLLHCDDNLTDATGQRTVSVATGSVSYTGGYYDNAVYLNGNTILSVPLTDDVKLGSNDFTIAFWVKFDEGNEAYYDHIVTQCHYYSSTYDAAGVRIRRASESDTTAPLTISAIFNSTYSASSRVTSTTTFDANTWYHIAVVRSGDTIMLFVNGTMESSMSFTTAVYSGGTRPWLIGGLNDTSSSSNYNSTNYFHGAIDEFIFVNGTALWTADFKVPTRPWK